MRNFIFVFIAVLSFHPLFAQQARGVAFTIVEKPPIFPNCKGINVDRLKECFNNNIEEIIEQHIDFKQFETTLPKGTHRVFVTFTIDKAGLVQNLKVRTPFTSVQKVTAEALAHIPLLEPAVHKELTSATAFATAFTIEVKKGKVVEEDTNPAALMRPRYSQKDY